MIRIDALWLAVDPVDMRAGPERLLARVVQVFGAARAHHGYLFANARATRIKLLVRDVWNGVFDRADAATIRRARAGFAVASAGANAGHHAHVMPLVCLVKKNNKHMP
jgi:transposase